MVTRGRKERGVGAIMIFPSVEKTVFQNKIKKGNACHGHISESLIQLVIFRRVVMKAEVLPIVALALLKWKLEAVAAARMAWMDGGEAVWWHGIPTPKRVVPEGGPHSSGVFPHVHRPLQAAGFARNLQCRGWLPALPLRSAGPSCTRHLFLGFVAWSVLSWLSDLSSLCTAAACLMLPGEVQDVLPCTQEGNLLEGDPPFHSPK